MNQVATINECQAQQSPFQVMAQRLSVDPDTVQNLMTNTLMKAKGNNGQVTNDELLVFMSIANEYRLNPLTKEIYAFNNRGAIQPIVSIDGWLRIINGHSQFDGMEFDDKLSDNGQLMAITCRIHRKDRSKPTEVTEYLAECQGTSEPWKKWPVRMLRHKATIQCARYAFGLSGIIDEDEAERYKQTNIEREIEPRRPAVEEKLERTETLTDDEIKQLQDAAADAGVDAQYVCEKAHVESLADMKRSRFNAALNHLQKLAAAYMDDQEASHE